MGSLHFKPYPPTPTYCLTGLADLRAGADSLGDRRQSRRLRLAAGPGDSPGETRSQQTSAVGYISAMPKSDVVDTWRGICCLNLTFLSGCPGWTTIEPLPHLHRTSIQPVGDTRSAPECSMAARSVAPSRSPCDRGTGLVRVFRTHRGTCVGSEALWHDQTVEHTPE